MITLNELDKLNTNLKTLRDLKFSSIPTNPHFEITDTDNEMWFDFKMDGILGSFYKKNGNTFVICPMVTYCCEDGVCEMEIEV